MDKLIRLLGNTMTWAFAGVIFGGAFTALYDFWVLMGVENWLALIWATILAGTVTAAFFGSLVVAMAGTLTGILVAISYQIIFAPIQTPWILLATSFLLGLISGGFFSRRELAQYQPLGQAGSGSIAGLFSGLLLSLVVFLTNYSSADWVLSTIAVALVGLSYVFLSRHIPLSMREGIMLKVGGPLVCAMISVSVTLAFWLIGESMDMYWSDEPISRYYNSLVNVPTGALGGALGGILGGIGLELLGIKIERKMYVG